MNHSSNIVSSRINRDSACNSYRLVGGFHANYLWSFVICSFEISLWKPKKPQNKYWKSAQNGTLNSTNVTPQVDFKWIKKFTKTIYRHKSASKIFSRKKIYFTGRTKSPRLSLTSISNSLTKTLSLCVRFDKWCKHGTNVECKSSRCIAHE